MCRVVLSLPINVHLCYFHVFEGPVAKSTLCHNDTPTLSAMTKARVGACAHGEVKLILFDTILP